MAILGSVFVTCGSPNPLLAQPCVPIRLLGLPASVEGGERIRVTAELTTDCNYKVVDEAMLVCRFGDGRESRYRMELFPRQDHTQAEAVFVMPEAEASRSGTCFIDFSQCNHGARTCDSGFTLLVGERPSPPPVAQERRPLREPAPPAPLYPKPRSSREPGTAPEPSRRGPPEPRPSPVPRPSPEPYQIPPQAPSVRSGGGTFFKTLGWIGVAVGAAAYADAGTKEGEGRLQEARDARELGDQILVASGSLLLLGYGIDAATLTSAGDPSRPPRIRPMVLLDPVQEAVYVQVTFALD